MEIEKIIEILKNYFSEQPVIKAWLFGSVSRGEATQESDVDILVLFDEGVGLFKYAKMIDELQNLLHKSIDLVSETALLPWVKETVEKEKLLIYERKTA
ncbi:MAG: nucleotidyltransferase family protein [Bacteroides sp.]|nr:nucleotidyltransferase family protein [Bacteroides sp.]